MDHTERAALVREARIEIKQRKTQRKRILLNGSTAYDSFDASSMYDPVGGDGLMGLTGEPRWRTNRRARLASTSRGRADLSRTWQRRDQRRRRMQDPNAAAD